jgi:hypothetical protein
VSQVRHNKIKADVNFTLPRLTPSRKYALGALLLLKIITTDADTIKRWAIFDLGATSHFLTTSALATNILPTATPIIARFSNGNRVDPTHTCTLDIPSLPPGACAAHIIPGLALHSHLSIITMCYAGCTITFSKIGCTIMYRGRMIVCGHKCTRTGLWMISLTNITTPPTLMPTTSPISIELAANVNATSLAAKYARYVHQLLCSPPAATLLLAIEKCTKLQTIPGLMPDCIDLLSSSPINCHQQRPYALPPRQHCINTQQAQ